KSGHPAGWDPFANELGELFLRSLPRAVGIHDARSSFAPRRVRSMARGAAGFELLPSRLDHIGPRRLLRRRAKQSRTQNQDCSHSLRDFPLVPGVFAVKLNPT